MKKYYEYSGCIHVHSTFSDGSGAIPEIIKDAQSVGLDFLMISDHMSLEGKRRGYHGWHGNTLVLIGYEINDSNDAHHYLAFGLDEELPANIPPQEYIKQVEEKGGWGIAAHPYEDRQKGLPGYPALPWQSIDYPQVKIIELWNLMSHWLDLTTRYNKYWHVIHPRSFSTRPFERLKREWDLLNQKRKVTAIAGVDAHATLKKLFGLFTMRIFPYKVMFKALRTQVLLEEPISHERDVSDCEKEIFTAITGGKTYLANWRWGKPAGFTLEAEIGDTVYTMGDEASLNGRDVRFRVTVPSPGIIHLIRNGEIIFSEKGKSLKFNSTQPGLYRIEVLKSKKGWIYSNHINVKA